VTGKGVSKQLVGALLRASNPVAEDLLVKGGIDEDKLAILGNRDTVAKEKIGNEHCGLSSGRIITEKPARFASLQKFQQ